ncbi:Ig-like domain-containing protein [Actinocorallia herbida]|uniref:Ig-like domain-containing protein n=1 Tax=Actinocorallia herbida TaxID=58109 RepID=A0A3N1DA52_9ACTN|nr:NBR1-Ig-like domain-containing protein [Actinocorallia herbida]ROO90401.1 Ig-like domain-containing protein [Actinocorallia herbida]
MREPAQADGRGRRGRKAQRPDPEEGPVPAFADRLWRLKREAGDPSFAEMCGRMGAAASKSTLAAAAQGRTLPSWGTTWEFVRVLAVDRLGRDPERTEREWHEDWLRARALAGGGVPDAAPAFAARDAVAEDANQASTPARSTSEARDAHSGIGSGASETRHANSGAAGDTSEAQDGIVTGGTREAPEAAPPQAGTRRARIPAPRTQLDEVTGPQTVWRPPAKRSRLQAGGLIAAGALGALVAVAAFAFPGGDGDAPPQKTAMQVDDSVFEGDITVPDGTRVQPGAWFEKVWRLRNTGTVAWSARFLMRVNDAACESPERVEIPHTAPGQSVDIRVLVQASEEPGTCRIYWKMVDLQGRTLFPGKRPIFLDVRIE